MNAPLDRRANEIGGGNMPRNPILGGAARGSGRASASSIACLGFVVFLAVAFWAGAIWIAETLLRLTSNAW